MDQHQFNSTEWLELVGGLGGEERLGASAREHKSFLRPRGVKTASDLLRLALMYGPGGQSLRALAVAAATDGVAQVSDVALLNRLRGAADWLEALCADRLAAMAGLVRGTAEARAIRIIDGSRLPGPGQRDWRLHLSYDPIAGRLVEAKITPLKQGERLDRLTARAGEIWLGDRNFPRPDGLRHVRAADADILVRLTWNSLHLTDDRGQVLDWTKLLETASSAGSLDMPVRVCKARGKFEPINMRLVIIKKPPDVAARTRAAASKASRKDQHARLDPRTLASADHLILLTSLPADTFPIDRLADLYRLRWQVELVFKRLKSILHMDRLPAKDPRLARAWLHAHLLFALLVDAAQAEVNAFSP
jgi:hypothetical protein